jgi:glycosyltransferase involved in cell wall biosynthesis
VVATSSIEISIVIPTLDEATSLAQTLIAARERGAGELIVADGESRDATRDVAARLADAVVLAPRGRAAQMNAGAAVRALVTSCSSCMPTRSCPTASPTR